MQTWGERRLGKRSSGPFSAANGPAGSGVRRARRTGRWPVFTDERAGMPWVTPVSIRKKHSCIRSRMGAETTSSVRREGSDLLSVTISAPDRHQGLPARSQLMTGHWPVIQDAAHPLRGKPFGVSVVSENVPEDPFSVPNGPGGPGAFSAKDRPACPGIHVCFKESVLADTRRRGSAPVLCKFFPIQGSGVLHCSGDLL